MAEAHCMLSITFIEFLSHTLRPLLEVHSEDSNSTTGSEFMDTPSQVTILDEIACNGNGGTSHVGS